ncbi:MAG: serine/threonine protein kinase [Gammaproteobacteria bacterium]|nr:serine/threonine protein kinase [Gammaproteobacteria bacterium]
METPFANLTPDLILDATEQTGLMPTGALQALNSFENRVYKIGTEEGAFAIKFYRPARWTDAAIAEEHAFTQELVDAEIPAVAPHAQGGHALQHRAGYRFALFPWRPGRTGMLETADERMAIGRYLGRLHMAGYGRFCRRLTLDVPTFVDPAITTLAESPFLPPDLLAPFRTVAGRLREVIHARLQTVAPDILRLHGDCHAGNILFDGERFAIVDFDDSLNGPAIQDLWMLLPGDRADQEDALRALLAGYEMFRPFDRRELALIEPLRALRLLHYNAWIARRWHDPAFPRAFPWFAEDRHFRELVGLLQAQEARLDAPPLLAGAFG